MEELIHQFMVVTEGLDLPEGEIYFGIREPQGRARLLRHRPTGGPAPWRLRMRAPSFVNLAILPYIFPGAMSEPTSWRSSASSTS